MSPVLFKIIKRNKVDFLIIMWSLTGLIIFVTLKYQFYNGREKEVVHGIKVHAKVLLDEIMGTGKWSSSFIV